MEQSKLDTIKELEAKLNKLKAEARAERLKEVKAEIVLFGFTAKELGLSTTSTTTEEEVVSVEQKTRKKAKILYRDPENENNTWAGRGIMPKWLQAKLDAGHKLEDFKLPEETEAEQK